MDAQDPLAALRPIHLPANIGWWPPAPGWWVVGLLSLSLLAVACVLVLRRWRANGYRRAALRELDALFAALDASVDHSALAAQCNALLRRSAMCRYASGEVAALTGKAWLEFLDQSGRSDDFSQGAGRPLAAAAYAPAADFDTAALHRACRAWLRRHR